MIMRERQMSAVSKITAGKEIHEIKGLVIARFEGFEDLQKVGYPKHLRLPGSGRPTIRIERRLGKHRLRYREHVYESGLYISVLGPFYIFDRGNGDEMFLSGCSHEGCRRCGKAPGMPVVGECSCTFNGRCQEFKIVAPDGKVRNYSKATS